MTSDYVLLPRMMLVDRPFATAAAKAVDGAIATMLARYRPTP